MNVGQKTKLLLASVGLLLIGLAPAHGGYIDITIPDGSVGPANSNAWYRSANEDQEVEPNCVISQVWDLERFYMEGKSLYMVGGYDFKNGVGGYPTGDIFFDVTGDAISRKISSTFTANSVVNDNFGYEYALRMNFTNNTYQLYYLDESDGTLRVTFSQNSKSNPWKYQSGGGLAGTGSFEYYVLSDSEAGTQFGEALSSYDPATHTNLNTHYAVEVDLDFLGYGAEFWVHNTMKCGNDDLMGHGTTPVPEPGTMILLGSGLVAIAGYGRKRLKK